ncbi:MAG: carboxylesterase family protein [Spirochaetaceae bacterium]|nr:carboxylesterase family protein [Spirochaetaceae bacterium]
MLREVQTKYGKVRGLPAADPRITSFKGIPFAAPPVGKNRWRAPQPCEKWEGVKDCYKFAPISVQNTPGLGTDVYCKEWHVDPQIDMGEDNLYLNIWTPAKKADEKLPVLVWYFGGSFQWGYTAEMEFDGERLARRGIVVVSVNYRLNVFGFLAHPEITKEAPEEPTNFGLLDQRAGLKWVYENISAFGGDPEKITIAGQSAGAGSVMHQITTEKNKGLIKGAVVFSGMISSPFGKGGIGCPMKLDEAEKWGVEFFKFLGAKSLDEARAIEPFKILAKYDEFVVTHPRMFTVQDGKFCTAAPTEMLLQGKCLDIPIIAGNTADEFLNFIPAADDAELEKVAAQIYGADAEKFLSFPQSKIKTGKSPEFPFGPFGPHIIGDKQKYAEISGIELTVKKVFEARKALGSKNSFYYYRFNPDIPGPDNPGTFHSVDLWFFFETLAKCWRPFVGRHYDLARQMCNYWVNFIKSGNPNGNDSDGTPLPEWKPYEAATRCEMEFTANGSVLKKEEDSAYKDFLKAHML